VGRSGIFIVYRMCVTRYTHRSTSPQIPVTPSSPFSWQANENWTKKNGPSCRFPSHTSYVSHYSLPFIVLSSHFAFSSASLHLFWAKNSEAYVSKVDLTSKN
jgi:hypothetical protein